MSRLRFLLLTIVLQGSAAWPIFAQTPTNTSPVLAYTLSIDTTDLSGYTMTIHVYHAPSRFHLAMATHHEYDDRYWRFVTAFSVQAPASFSRDDSAVWTITTPGEEAFVTYRVHLPPPAPFRFSHRPFLTPSGGLVGDLHSFMYLVEAPNATSVLTLLLPYEWQAATGLEPMPPPTASEPPRPNLTFEPGGGGRVWYPFYFEPVTAPQLLDAPILVGRLRRWTFTVESIPHEVAYLPATQTLNFDTVALVANTQQVVRAARDIFGSFPYKHYSFLLEESSEGALEHRNSVTIGVSAAELAPDRPDIYEEIAHEFFHTWNLMDIRPSGYTEVNYGKQQQSPGLWFSEGVTMLYADLICRRTGLQVEDTTRIAHLTSLLTRYYRDTGNAVLLPARVSLASDLQPGPLGDYAASTHLQGELMGTCLDILIRDETDGRKSLDDVMRELFRRYGGKTPIRDSDIETVVNAVCGCGVAGMIVEGGNPIDFTPWLRKLGLRLRHEQPTATDTQGRPLPDTRVYSWVRRDETSLRFGVTNPNSCWALAGIHTGDLVTSINGRPIHTRQDFQAALGTLQIGQIATVKIRKDAATIIHKVKISGYTKPVITIIEDPAATPKQRRLLRQWLDAI